MQLKMKKFDISKLKGDHVSLVIGKRATGKTTMALEAWKCEQHVTHVASAI